MIGFKEQAIPLIVYNQDTQVYDVCEEATNFIKSIPAPIGVITVAGLYRTGKSYLLNRMLLNKQSGFGVGPTINACTKGLWVWGTPIKGQTPEGDMINILIVDSEGIGSLTEDQAHDTRVFSLAILLGSCFIYNSVGNIDENAIQNLSLVVNLTKHIHIKSNNEEVDSEDYSPYFPSFFWIIRDFSLQLVDEENEPITSKEYLEKALSEQKGFSDEVEEKNRIRRLLSSFFKERECITMVRPVLNEEHLQKLDQMELDQLRPEFFEQVMNLRKRILTRCKPKTLNGVQLNGEMFISLTKNYLTAINDGAVPNIENAWSYLCKNECQKAEQTSYEFYEKLLKENIFPRIPASLDELKNIHKQIKDQVIELYRKKAIGDVTDEFLTSLRKNIKQKFQIIVQQNDKESFNQCMSFIQREFNPIERKLKLNEYQNFGEYEKDLQLFQQFLNDHGPKGHHRKFIFSDFIRQVLAEGANYFVSKINNELDLQIVCAEDIQKKQEQDMKDLKDEFQKEKVQNQKKIAELERLKQEQANTIQKNQDTIAELNNQKKLIEQELSINAQRDRQEYTNMINGLKIKLQEVENQLQNSEREQLMQASNFKKEKALLEHKAQHFEKLVEEYSFKEKSFDTSITSTKQEMNIQIKEINSKHEKIVKDLQLQIQEIQEKNQDLIEKSDEKIKSLEQNNEVLSKLKEKNAQVNQELSNQINNLKKELMNIQLQEKQNSNSLKQDLVDQIENLQNDNAGLIQKLKQTQENAKTSLLESKKNEALLDQKLQFIQSQFEDCKQQLVDLKRQHDSTIDAFEMNNQDHTSKMENKQMILMKENHIHDIKQLQQEHQLVKTNLHKQIEQLQKEREELELNSRMQLADLHNQVTELQDEFQQTNNDKNKLQEQLIEAEENLKLSHKDIEQKNQFRISELEDQLQEIKEKMQSEHIEFQSKSEESLSQLKNFYELEKERIENRLIDEREKSIKSYNNIVEEYENRLRDEQVSYEDEIENLKDELNQCEMQIANLTSQYEHEMNLNSKNIENLEKLLKESKDQLQISQSNFQTQIEQQQNLFNFEKKQLSEKLDSITVDYQKKDKDYTITLQKKEQLESNLVRKEEQCNTMKIQYNQEKAQLIDKQDELKKSFSDLQNELLENKINYEKTIALSNQQNQFFSKKVEELEKQLELSSTRYEDRIKQQKQEWMQELTQKLGKNQEDKLSLEIKYDNLKKQQKENQLTNQKQINQLEKEKAISIEKISNLEQKLKDIEEKYQSENQQLDKNLQQSRETQQATKQTLQSEVDECKKVITQLDAEKHEIQSSYERDKALWESKQQFLESQKEQAKQDHQDSQRKFEQIIQNLNNKRQADKLEHEQNVTERLVQLENKYQQQIKELNDTQQTKIQEALEKSKKYEKELKNQNDKVLLDQQSKSSNQLYTEKRLNEMIENEKKYQQDIEKLKSEREQKTMEVQKQIDKLKDQNKLKLNELEDKCREGEKKRSTMIFEHEKERAKWSLEKDHLLSQKNDFQDNINKLEKKLELLTRENERLKNDTRGQRRPPTLNMGASFQLNASRNMSSDKKSPVSTTNNNLNLLNRERYSNIEFSMNSNDRSNTSGINTSQEELFNKENIKKFSILQDLKEEPKPSGSTTQGFQFYYQKQQEKTPERQDVNKN